MHALMVIGATFEAFLRRSSSNAFPVITLLRQRGDDGRQRLVETRAIEVLDLVRQRTRATCSVGPARR